MLYFWNESTIIIPYRNGFFRLFQPLYRRNLVVESRLLVLAERAIESGITEDDAKSFWGEQQGGIRMADVTEFTLWECATGNPDFMPNDVELDECLELLDHEGGFAILEDAHVIERERHPEFDYSKRNFGDRFRGSFFEQVGTEALFNREPPTEWWTRQKFSEDLKEIRQTPYRYIEEEFLTKYFADNFKGLDVLEIGCGTGYFTRKIASSAASIVGMDYNEEYIASARASIANGESPNLEFHVGNMIDMSGGETVFTERLYDRIILIDTFLFLFDASYQSELEKNKYIIMENIRSMLKPDGVLLIMDPHPFWLTPWIGHEDMPVGILTEYRNRYFKVVPTIEEYTCFLDQCGMRVRRILEPTIAPEYESIDPRAYNFLSQFPQWWFFEAEKTTSE